MNPFSFYFISREGKSAKEAVSVSACWRKSFCMTIISCFLLDSSYFNLLFLLRFQELSSLLILCIGRMEEELILLFNSNSKGVKQFESEIIASSPKSFPVPKLFSKPDNNDIVDSVTPGDFDRAAVENLNSSGLIFTDLMTSLTLIWVRRSHSQVTERFFR